MESHYSQEQEELLQEHLSDDEVRELLTRLGSDSLGGDERPTVGAVVEATGASPVEVGRLLADIRQEDLESRFASTFDNHEHRIKKLETVVPRQRPSRGELDSEKQEALDALAERELQRRAFSPVAAVVLFIVAVVFVVAMANQSARGQTSTPGTGFGITDPATGREMERTIDGSYVVREKDGSQRPATAAERDEIDMSEAMLTADRSRGR